MTKLIAFLTLILLPLMASPECSGGQGQGYTPVVEEGDGCSGRYC